MRKKSYPFVGLLLIFWISLFQKIHAQDSTPAQTCGTEAAHVAYFKIHPEHLISKNVPARFKEKKNGNTKSSQNQSYTIPVVFHVFGTNFGGKKVTQETIEIALQKVNEDFQGQNDDYDDVADLFKPIRQKLDITFKLAKIDPYGNTTTGVKFYPKESGFGKGDADE